MYYNKRKTKEIQYMFLFRKGVYSMPENRGCGGFGFGDDCCWIIILILLICCCCGGGRGGCC
jgi:hypothetical protein